MGTEHCHSKKWLHHKGFSSHRIHGWSWSLNISLKIQIRLKWIIFQGFVQKSHSLTLRGLERQHPLKVKTATKRYLMTLKSNQIKPSIIRKTARDPCSQASYPQQLCREQGKVDGTKQPSPMSARLPSLTPASGALHKTMCRYLQSSSGDGGQDGRFQHWGG